MFGFFLIAKIHFFSHFFQEKKILPGIFQTERYLPLLKNHKIGLIVNHTSVFETTHLLDSLLSLDIDVQKIFALEHGFRGTVEAGAYIENQKDEKTNLPIISLYGKNKKPQAKDLEDIDLLIFDVQDVGVRFYTYISSLYYMLEISAEHQKKIIILDRPNPHLATVDGPILQEKFRSFVGLYPIPILYGMTIGELAQMAIGEKWLKNSKIDLTVIPCLNYNRTSTYILPISPSPNLKNQSSIYVYPTLALLEGTTVSEGRGTDFPFEVMGYPASRGGEKLGSFNFIPQERSEAKNPKFKNQTCTGIFFRDSSIAQQSEKIAWRYLIQAYQNDIEPEKFFLKNLFFDRLVGTDAIRLAILAGKTEAEIRASYQTDLEVFLDQRKKYLLYP